MTAQANPSKAERNRQVTLRQPRHDHLDALAARLVTWCETCTDYYNAAATFEELSVCHEPN